MPSGEEIKSKRWESLEELREREGCIIIRERGDTIVLVVNCLANHQLVVDTVTLYRSLWLGPPRMPRRCWSEIAHIGCNSGARALARSAWVPS